MSVFFTFSRYLQFKIKSTTLNQVTKNSQSYNTDFRIELDPHSETITPLFCMLLKDGTDKMLKKCSLYELQIKSSSNIFHKSCFQF